jgi:hypothetical protein
MTVLELDQWSATAVNLTEIAFQEFVADPRGTLQKLYGGDSLPARQIFGGHAEIREVTEQATPPRASVWYIEGETGLPVRYRYNFDSSD